MNEDVQKLDKANRGHKRINADNEGLPYHDRKWAEDKLIPGSVDRKHNAALDLGDSNAEDFLNKVYDYKHPDNARATSTYVDKYNSDPEAVKKDMRNAAINLMNAPRLEKKNIAYENSVFSRYRISTQQDAAFVQKFKDFIKEKWNAIGYADDPEFIDLFWSLHPLSMKPLNTGKPVTGMTDFTRKQLQ